MLYEVITEDHRQPVDDDPLPPPAVVLGLEVVGDPVLVEEIAHPAHPAAERGDGGTEVGEVVWNRPRGIRRLAEQRLHLVSYNFV